MKAEETKIGPNTMPVSKGMDIRILNVYTMGQL